MNDSRHGEIVNFLGKLAGVCFIVVGGVMFVWSVSVLIGRGQPNGGDNLIIGGAGFTVAILGWLLVKAKPSNIER
jgi:hypothetical protein